MRLVEYRPAPLTLAPADLEHLLGLMAGADGQSRVIRAVTPRGGGRYEVTAGPYVGRLALPSGASIELRSRFGFEDVVELIRRAARLPAVTNAFRAAGTGERFLLDVVAVAFCREAERLVGQGLAKGYQQVRRLEPPYPGRLDTAYHVGRLGARADRLATLTRKLTPDGPENQALARALDVLSHAALGPAAAARLTALAPAFAPIRRTRPTAVQVESIRLTNLTRRYAPALGLAAVVLRGLSVSPRAGATAGRSLLFHMPTVWESFVSDWLAERHPGRRIVAPHTFQLTDDGGTAEADATVWDGPELVALYDAKYKWPGSAPDRGDLYQMLAYCRALNLSEATLLYPVQQAERVVRVGGAAVRVLGVRPVLSETAAPGSAP